MCKASGFDLPGISNSLKSDTTLPREDILEVVKKAKTDPTKYIRCDSCATQEPHVEKYIMACVACLQVAHVQSGSSDLLHGAEGSRAQEEALHAVIFKPVNPIYIDPDPWCPIINPIKAL